MTKQVLRKDAVPLSPVVGADDFVAGRKPVWRNGATACGAIGAIASRPLLAKA